LVSDHGAYVLGEHAPLLAKLVNAGFVETEPASIGRVLVRLTPQGGAALRLRKDAPHPELWRKDESVA
jgi:hypothetical protein